MNRTEPFGLASVIVPAKDSVLTGLGFQVENLGLKGLGLVIETRKGKSLIAFPDLTLKVWLDHAEMADVFSEAAKGNVQYLNLLSEYDGRLNENVPMVFVVNRLFHHFEAKYLLSVEKGDWKDIWDENIDSVSGFSKEKPPVVAEKISLGVEEFFEEKWNQGKSMLGQRLYVARVLPAGLHKLELSFYCRPSGFNTLSSR